MMYMHTVLILTYLVYIDGQYMASRISRSITKQTAKMKALMNEFHTLVPANENVSWEPTVADKKKFAFRFRFRFIAKCSVFGLLVK